mmetsp:Transcript_50739/g.100931  ORF Transcript_50739/g.100931 Transcript_50739/m.100931 type:complete len:259 (-) Transcript_50739:260-1036(-)|eukprot:CAMPEP_0172740896 /NCGR_PEP_ID=MMETSP1074-20121228/125832_1 /TAXON_ID=2916 /ORGANISM="Ceratium fusus, Strain PA161109" /LENGTH=258 /DNA_ID=CAMNT_0013571107 /DNA_START=75 /DNA_END=851 /DNA_ORIENTATION=-
MEAVCQTVKRMDSSGSKISEVSEDTSDALVAETSGSLTASFETACGSVATAGEAVEEPMSGLICNKSNNRPFNYSHRHCGLMVLLSVGLILAVACSFSIWQKHPQNKLRVDDSVSETASKAREDEHAFKEASGFLGLLERSTGSAAGDSSQNLGERRDDPQSAPNFSTIGTMADSLAKSNMPGAGGRKAPSPVVPSTPTRSTPQQLQQPPPGHGKAAAVASSDLPGVGVSPLAPIMAWSQRGMPDNEAEPKDQSKFFF